MRLSFRRELEVRGFGVSALIRRAGPICGPSSEMVNLMICGDNG